MIQFLRWIFVAYKNRRSFYDYQLIPVPFYTPSVYDLRDSFSNSIFLKQLGCLAVGIAYLRAGVVNVTTVIKTLEKHELNLEQTT